MSEWIQSGNHPEVEVNLTSRQVRYTRSKRVLVETNSTTGSRFFSIIVGAREGRLEAGAILKQVRVAELAAEAAGYGPVRMVDRLADPWRSANWVPAGPGAVRIDTRTRPVQVTDLVTGEVIDLGSYSAVVRWLAQRGIRTSHYRLNLAFKASPTAEVGDFRLFSYS